VLFSRIQLLRRADKIAAAAELMLSAPHEVAQIYDPDEWWVERRLLARKLLDTNAAPKAYRIVRDAAPPNKENFRVEHEFTAGWIALRRPAPSASARLPRGKAGPSSYRRFAYREFAPRGNEAVPVLSYTQSVSLNK
jgi:soluble lytic murein transglycosylase